MQEIEQWLCRWSPTLGNLEDSADNVWGTRDFYAFHSTKMDAVPAVFFGLYGLPDWFSLWRHKGKKAILWAGSDIRHFVNGYWLDNAGSIRLDPAPLAKWISENCDSYVENQVEYDALAKVGILSIIIPSFLGDIDAFEVSYKPSTKPKLYTSVSGDDFKLYGWDKVPQLARENPDVEFHCYGNTSYPWPLGTETDAIWEAPNVILHGRVPKEQMNAEIKEMQGALRLTEFDGFSEILAKSVLMGQYPVSLIPYPFMLSTGEINRISSWEKPNTEGRNYYRKILNKYPWNVKNN